MNNRSTITKLTQLAAIAMIYCALNSHAADGDARNSKQIEGPADFQFATFNTTTFDISVEMMEASTEPAAKVIVSAVDDGIEDLDDPALQNKQTLFTARPNEQGQIYRQVSISNHVKLLLLETHVDGDVVSKLVPYEGQENIDVYLSQ